MAALNGLIYVFGGDEQLFNDMYVYDPENQLWTELTPTLSANSGFMPGGRMYHNMVAAGGNLFIFGADLWIVDVERLVWNPCLGLFSSLLPNSMAKAGVVGDWIYFGLGIPDRGNGAENVIYKWNSKTLAWSTFYGIFSGTLPGTRLWAPLAEVSSKAFVFGGSRPSWAGQGSLGDLFMLNGEDLVWQTLTSITDGQPPQARDRHGLASINQTLFVFGGMSNSDQGSWVLGDLHMLDVVTWNWVDLTSLAMGGGPVPRHSHGFVSCLGKLYVMGGLSSTREDEGYLGDLHVLDPGVVNLPWAQLSIQDPSIPSPRFGHGLTCSSSKLYLFGGKTRSGLENDLHEFNINVGVWIEITDHISGSLPLARCYFGFTSKAEQLYVFGGTVAGGYMNDLYVFDIESNSVSEIGGQIKGSAPVASEGPSALVVVDRLLVFGVSQANANPQQDVFKYVFLPKRHLWPYGGLIGGFLDVFDWDTVAVGPEATILRNMVLGTGIMPSSLLLIGNPRGNLSRSQGISISCYASDSCHRLVLRSVDFQCFDDDSESLPVSFLQVRGTDLNLINTSFTGCFSATDGAVVRSHEGARVQVVACLFRSIRSQNFGGVISVVGSFLRVVDSFFLDCVADSGGGAIAVSSSFCYFSKDSGLNSMLDVKGSIFEGCRTQQAGGAILASSEDTDGYAPTVRVRVNVTGCMFDGGGAIGPGGAIAAGGVTVSVGLHGCSFRDLFSDQTGGAISSVDSSMLISNCIFVHVRAFSAGGAVYLSTALSGSGNQTSRASEIDSAVIDSQFVDCFTNGFGGAFAATSKLSVTDVRMRVQLEDCEINGCEAEGYGGGVHFSGSSVLGVVNGSTIMHCRAGESGGACVLEGAAEVHLFRTGLVNNTANHTGGGIYVHSATLHVDQVSASANRAIQGGGGALMWSGTINSNVHIAEPSKFHCEMNNVAAYGPCVASIFHNLQLTPLSSRIYAGLSFEVNVFKRDVYGQSITTDSMSLLEVLAGDGSESLVGDTVVSLLRGQATVTLAVNPLLASLDNQALTAKLAKTPQIYLRGIDAEQPTVTMQSPTLALGMMDGEDVCPGGFILILDQSDFGSCFRCGTGTYTLSPLGGASTSQSSCIPCPPKAECDGGSHVNLSVGVWITERTFYRLVACPRNHQLLDSLGGVFNLAAQQCQPCPPGQFNLNPNSSRFSCHAWSFATYVKLAAVLPLTVAAFDDSARMRYVTAVAVAAQVNVNDVQVSDPQPTEGGRRATAAVALDAKVGAANASSAALAERLQDRSILSRELAAQDLPSPLRISATVVTSGGVESGLGLAVGASVASLVALFGLSALIIFVGLRIRRHRAYQALVVACERCQAGDEAEARHLPLPLRQQYVPVRVVGKGAFGCVVHARSRKTGAPVAVKIVLPTKSTSDQTVERRLQREGAVLRLLTESRCDTAVHLVGADAVHIEPQCGWILMELLDGDDLGRIVQENGLRFGDLECVRVAQSVLSALKLLHAEGLIHRDIKPANVMRCFLEDAKSAMANAAGDDLKAVYKLIDFGTAVGVDEKVVNMELMTVTDCRDAEGGTPPYMSPEMYLNPTSVRFPTDLWSLGVMLFEIATGRLPFEAKDTSQLAAWARAVAGNPDERAPNLLDRLDEDRRARFDGNLARVVARALEKDVSKRYGTADEMHDAVYSCLVSKGEAFYSAFISYRVASEAPLARLLFDELNHSMTPGGHRVTVYWDAFRLVKGEDWEEGFATGLLSSLCIFPILSFGSTAPLAALPPSSAGADTSDWPAQPLGVTRLRGADGDREDNVLKEWLIARILLKRRQRGTGGGQDAGPLGNLETTYPILVGRPHPPGHPCYPGMGSFFEVQAGGGAYPTTPSPPTARAVSAFLRDKAGLPNDVADAAMQSSVASVVSGISRLQGCMLWKQAPDMQEVELTKEQADMVGTGYVGPPVKLAGAALSAEQATACAGGYDARQLRMLKALVRSHLADFHEVIDEAYQSRLAQPAETPPLPLSATLARM